MIALLAALIYVAALGVVGLERARRTRCLPLRNLFADMVLLLAAGAGSAWLLSQSRLEAALALGCGAVAALADGRTGYIFDGVVLPGAFLQGIVAASGAHVASTLGGALVAAALPLLAAWLSGGRAMGWGDWKLAMVLGAGVGGWSGLSLIAVACIVGGAVTGTLLLFGRIDRRSEVAFAPFLYGGFLVTLSAQLWSGS
ncbi:MAG: prepilin peptidase [Vulcanimicrobiaceae bacterium]